MKTLPALLIACGALAVAQARPLVIQESARIVNPDPANFPYFAADVAIDGDDAIATLERYFDAPEGGNPNDEEHEVAVHLFHRTTGGWTPVRQLVLHHHRPFTSFNSGLAMRNGIAALALNPLYVFERRNGNWVSAPITGVDPAMPGDSITIDGTRILFGGTSGQWQGTLYEKNTAGIWGPTSIMLGDVRGGDDEFTGGPVDISGDRAVVLSPYNEEEFPVASPGVTVFREWGPPERFLRQSDIRRLQDAPLGFEVAVRGDEIFIAGTNLLGHARLSPGAERCLGRVRQAAAARQPHGRRRHDRHREEPSFLMQRNWNAEREAYVINVFRKSTAGPTSTWRRWCRATAHRSGNFGISSRRVIANCGNEACYFELPTSLSQPAPIQHTFAGATPTGWSMSAGSAFSIVRRGVSRVLRQTDTRKPRDTHRGARCVELDQSVGSGGRPRRSLSPAATAGTASRRATATPATTTTSKVHRLRPFR